MPAYGLMTMYNIQASIATVKSGGEWGTYAPLDEGFDNISEALNEVVQQYFFLSDDGFAKNHVTGMAPAFTLTGRRIMTDTAQNYIFSKKYSLDEDRQSSFKLAYTDGSGAAVELVCDCTFVNLQEWSGASTDDSAISVEIRFDGKPTVTTTPAS